MNDHDPTDITREVAQLDERGTAREAAALTRTEDFRWLMSSEKGRRIAWSILELTHPFMPSMTGDANTFHLEGERNVGLKFMALLAQADRPHFAKMMQEHYTP